MLKLDSDLNQHLDNKEDPFHHLPTDRKKACHQNLPSIENWLDEIVEAHREMHRNEEFRKRVAQRLS